MRPHVGIVWIDAKIYPLNDKGELVPQETRTDMLSRYPIQVKGTEQECKEKLKKIVDQIQKMVVEEK